MEIEKQVMIRSDFMGQTLFVSSKGDDRNSGTEEQPFATMYRPEDLLLPHRPEKEINLCNQSIQ